MAHSDPPSPTGDDGLLVLLPAVAGERWRWWRVESGRLGPARDYTPDEGATWDEPGEGERIVALVPADRVPVRVRPVGAMPPAQALSTARLESGAAPGAEPVHVAVALSANGGGILVASVSPSDMDLWLAELATAGLGQASLVPLSLVLPESAAAVVADIEGQPVARTPNAAFAAEPALLDALGAGEAARIDGEALADALARSWREPPLDLRQGIYAPRRVSFFRLPDWQQTARMAAVAALLGFLILAIETAKLNWDASAREAQALAAAQQRFPAAVDLATAQSLASAELARRGEGGGAFAAPASALLAAMRPIPSLRLRDLGYNADGTLRFQAAAPTADAVNQLLAVLQQQGWQVTVPPSLAPDPTGATVAAITVRAP